MLSLTDCYCVHVSDSGSVAHISLQEPEGSPSKPQCFPVRQQQLQPLCVHLTTSMDLVWSFPVNTRLTCVFPLIAAAMLSKCVWFSRMKVCSEKKLCVETVHALLLTWSSAWIGVLYCTQRTYIVSTLTTDKRGNIVYSSLLYIPKVFMQPAGCWPWSTIFSLSLLSVPLNAIMSATFLLSSQGGWGVWFSAFWLLNYFDHESVNMVTWDCLSLYENVCGCVCH